MTHSLTDIHQKYQSNTNTVFLSKKNQTTILCGLCEIFDSKQTVVCHKQIKFTNKIEPKKFVKQDSNVAKLNKKSLKHNSKLRQFFGNKADSVQRQIQNYQSQKIQNSTKINSESIIRSYDLKKTESSDKGFNLYRKPCVSFSQISNQNQISHSSSCINLNKNNIKNSLQISQKIQNQRFPHVEMVQSIKTKKSQISKSLKIYQAQQSKKTSGQNHNLDLVKFKSSSNQKFSALSISPVKPIIIPEESERSGLISCNRNDRDVTTINKLIELTSPPTLKKSGFQNESDRSLKTALNKNTLKDLKQHMINAVVPQKRMSMVPKYERDFSEKSKSEIDFLQLSIHQLDRQQEPILKNLNFLQERLTQQRLVEPFKEQNAIEIRVNAQKILSSSIKSDKESVQQKKAGQKPSVTVSKINKNGGNGFGRYSVQIPKSKNFSNMKVRRTISMKDQQDSSQEETSEVIYGFRKINNLEVMEDIAEDLQQSYMTRADIRFDTLEKLNFNQF